jgi:hypothetical protein
MTVRVVSSIANRPTSSPTMTSLPVRIIAPAIGCPVFASRTMPGRSPARASPTLAHNTATMLAARSTRSRVYRSAPRAQRQS